MHIRHTQPLTATSLLRPLFSPAEWEWILSLASYRKIEPEAMVVILVRLAHKHIFDELKHESE